MSNDEFLYWGIFYARKAQREQLAQLKSRGRSATH
jgi:hypothetical protein